ncbi:MAG: helix-turn-helix domain-containing protein [Bacteroidota bacterium]
MNWLRFLYGSSLVITSSFACIILFVESYNITTYFIMMLIVTAGKLIFISGLLFLALKYPDLIVERNYLKNRIAEGHDEKYAYSSLGHKEAEVILLKINEVMNSRKSYKTPGLTLENLSESICEDSKYVSQSINQLTGKNFKEYINTLRIKEAARMFADAEYTDMRINEIMYDVGFRSKSSFNSNFKKYTGYTPKEYRKLCLPDELSNND